MTKLDSNQARALVSYLALMLVIAAVFVLAAKRLGQGVNYVAGIYMLTPALAATITRLFFYDGRFSDAGLSFGKLMDYAVFWVAGIVIVLLYYVSFCASGAVSLDFTGQGYLHQLDQLSPGLSQQLVQKLPQGMTVTRMLFLYAAAGATFMNIPGILFGFGEEFGWRGLMFPLLYRISPLTGFIAGGLIWFAWHIPLSILAPKSDLSSYMQVLQAIVLAAGSICTFTFLAYAYVRTGSIFVPSFLHAVLNNASRSFSYWVEVKNQFTANAMLTLVMALVVLGLYLAGEFKVFAKLTASDPAPNPTPTL